MVDSYEERERRRKWAREVLQRLGFGMARDASGFYRPVTRPVPNSRQRRKRDPVQDQLKLEFER